MRAYKVLESCKRDSTDLCEYMIRREIRVSGVSRERIIERFEKMLDTMEAAAKHALDAPLKSVSGITGGDAYRYNEYIKSRGSLMGDIPAAAIAYALSGAETNASMGRIVACPTAGSCGIVPAAILATARARNLPRETVIRALIVSGLVGLIIADNACLVGAEGGCQAECGSAAAMAAAAVCYMLGGDNDACFHAGAIAIKNVLGLVCDPVGGLVEIPCIKRNAGGVVNALTSADLALAGVKSYIPFDEVVDAMKSVGDALPAKLKETALGGLADTASGRELKNKVFGQD